MAHRILLTDRQRSVLFDLPTDEASLRKHYTLADDDLEHIRARRRTENRIGFALQLCALRYPGRLLSHGVAALLQLVTHTPAAVERPLEMDLVDEPHHSKVRLADRLATVARVIAHLGLSMVRRPGTPLNHSNARR